ncbi:MAG: hypothetical protein COB04_10865 [Gammaproteobacteria bacterium]|nr:MAG: hypothetical protein COB04_10865 [Gammaproteobacteria bacterium]
MKRSAGILLLGSVMACSLAANVSYAAGNSGGFAGVLYGGLTVGGDELVTVEFEDGDDGTVEAGGFLLFGAGVKYRFENSPLEVQTTVGYHFDSENAENGDVGFSRIPLDVLGFYNTGNHRFGAGITYHLNPELSMDFDSDVMVSGNGDSIKFDNSIGLVADYNYLFGNNVAVGVRYTSIEYSSSRLAEDLDGSYIGITASYFLHN